MFRILRVPASLDKFFQPLNGPFHWDPCTDFRLLVLTLARLWGRRNVANRYRYLEAEHHRTRCNDFFWVERWEPEAALHQKAHALLRARRPGTGETMSLRIDDAKRANRGQAMAAIATMKAPTTDAYIWGRQYVWGTILFRKHVIPRGLPLDVKPEAWATLGVPVQKTPQWAAHRMREFHPPAGVRVVGLCEAYSLCPTVVKACREKHCHCAATLKSNRRLCKPGWKLKAGRHGRNQCRRRRTDILGRTQPPGRARYRFVDAGWRRAGPLGPRPVVCSRKGTAKKLRGLVTDAPNLAAADGIRPDDKRWTIEPWVQEVKQLLGLGPYQSRSYKAAVIHLPLGCFADALLTHRRIARPGAQGHRPPDKAADASTAAAQAQLRSLLWADLSGDLQEARHGQPVIAELERLRVA